MSVTIQAASVQSLLNIASGAVKVKFFPLEEYYQPGGNVVRRGSPKKNTGSLDFNATIAANVLTFEAYALPESNDSNNPARFRVDIYDSTGTNKLFTFREGITLPTTLGATVTWQQLDDYVSSPVPPRELNLLEWFWRYINLYGVLSTSLRLLKAGGTTGQVLKKASNTDYDVSWQNESGGGAGEANTASNVGTGGVGLFKQKTGVNLEFRNINNSSNKVSITLDSANNEVDFDVVEGNLTLAQSQITNLVADLLLKAPLNSPALTGTPTVPTAAAGTNTTQAASTAFVVAEILARLASNDAMLYKGAIDCSANPNYPAADAGHSYKVSVAGKIGGASGVNVEVGDLLICTTDGTSAGTQAAVGANWDILQVNLDGAVIGPASSVNARIATFNGTTGKNIQDGGSTIADVLARGNHTGQQAASTISDFNSAALAAAPAETAATIGNLIAGASSKTPIAADLVPISDSAASNVTKKVTFADFWAAIIAAAKAAVATINTGTNDATLITPLGLAGSKYLDQSGAKTYAAATGTDTYVATISPAITAYATGQRFELKFANANTLTTPTINLNGLGAKTIVKHNGAALAAGDIAAGMVCILVYDGTNFHLANPKASSGGGGGITNSAGNNVIPKSDGTNIIASQLQDNGTNIGVGGMTASFPSLKRSSTELQVRLADDSGFAPVKTGKLGWKRDADGWDAASYGAPANVNLTADDSGFIVVGNGGVYTLPSAPPNGTHFTFQSNHGTQITKVTVPNGAKVYGETSNGALGTSSGTNYLSVTTGSFNLVYRNKGDILDGWYITNTSKNATIAWN